MNDEYTPPRDILLNRAYNAITRDDYTPESIQAAIESLFDATRTAALEEAAEIAEEARASAAMQLRETDFPDSQYSQWVSGKCDMAAAIEITIRAAQKGTP